jgi:hypothetical protein
MLDVILGSIIVGVLLVICTFLVMVPYNFDKVLMSADREEIKKIPGPKGLPYLGSVFLFNVPPESEFNKCETLFVSRRSIT